MRGLVGFAVASPLNWERYFLRHIITNAGGKDGKRKKKKQKEEKHADDCWLWMKRSPQRGDNESLGYRIYLAAAGHKVFFHYISNRPARQLATHSKQHQGMCGFPSSLLYLDSPYVLINDLSPTNSPENIPYSRAPVVCRLQYLYTILYTSNVHIYLVERA